MLAQVCRGIEPRVEREAGVEPRALAVTESEPSRYEQWLPLDEVRHGECGKLHVRCEIDRQLPQLRPLLQCFEQCASAELEIPVSNCFLHFVRFILG